MSKECKDCAAPYFNPFETQPIRFLWWLDDRLHRLHRTDFLSRAICRLVDDMVERQLHKPDDLHDPL